MTTLQKRKILQRIVVVENDLEALRNARTELASSGYASATLSSGGGSRSYTRLDIGKLTEAISALTSELAQLKAMLRTGATGQGIWKSVLVVYDL